MFKIVQMVPALGWGGAQVFCIQLCNELATYPDYEVTLVSLYDHQSNHITKDAPWHGRLIYKYFFQRDIIHPVSISEEVFKGAVKEYGECIKTLIHNGSVAVQPSPKFQSVTDTINSF